MEELEIDGVKYRLVPVEQEKVQEENVLYDYVGDKNVLETTTERDEFAVPKANSVLRAKGKKYGYKERYKTGQLRPSDVMAYPQRRRITKQFDPEVMDPGASKQAGYSVWFGEGTTIDF